MKNLKFSIYLLTLGLIIFTNELRSQTYINGYVLYDTPHSFTEDVIILPEGELEVTSELYFAEDVKLIVQRAAKLTINGGLLSNLNNTLWRGVEVWGNTFQPQDEDYQGTVELKNYGKIEFAETAIRTIKAVDIPGGELLIESYAGGMVIATNSLFENNRVGLQFYAYPQISNSSFFNCTFENNDKFIEIPDYFIRIHRISGIKIVKCSFGNESEFYDYLGNGINSIDATFYVYGFNEDFNTFRQLNYGIKVVNTNTVYFPDIRNSYFSLNRRSVYISCADEARVTSCIFLNRSTDEYGLYLNNSTKYHIENSLFEGIEPFPGAPPPARLGIYINNSGALWNQVYNNTFAFFQHGIIAYGYNRNPFLYSGLCIECNDFQYGVYDIVVSGLENSQHGIAYDQGHNTGGNDTLPAGNTFSNASYTLWNFKNTDNMGFINYVYHGINPNNFKLIPFPYYSSQTMYREINPSATYNKEFACPSKLDSWSNTENERLAMNSADIQIEQKKDQLEELVDAGDTYMMNFNVLTSTPPEASELYTELIGESPFLSDTVLKSAIYKEDVLPNAMVRDILVANPQSAKNQGIMDALDERFEPMPEWMKEQILAGVNYTSAKENLETEIRYWDKKRSEHFENLYQYFRKDTVNPQASADSLVSLLVQNNRLESKYRLAFLNMKNGAWNATQQLLSSIPIQFELTSPEASVHQDYVALFSLLNQLNGELPAEGSQVAADLELLAERDEYYPGACARNLLIILGLMDYEEPVVLPEEELKSTEMYDQDRLNDPGKPDVLTIFPNPACGYFIIGYDAEGYTGEIIIKVNDMKGKPFFDHIYVIRRNQEVINTAGWQAGLYTISLTINGKTIETKKISIKN